MIATTNGVVEFTFFKTTVHQGPKNNYPDEYEADVLKILTIWQLDLNIY